MKNIFAVFLYLALLATSGQIFAAGTCTSGGAGLLDGTADDTPWAVATAAGTGCSNLTTAILAPDNTNALSIGHAITAPTAATISVSSVAFTAGGSLTLTGRTLNVGTTLNNNGMVTIGAGGTLSVTGTITNAGTLSANGGTLILGGNLNNTGGTFTPGTGTVKVLGSSTITVAADTVLNVLDLSALPSGSTITFAGAFNNTITTLTLPTANPAGGGAAKTVVFKVPSTKTLQIPAAFNTASTATTAGCVATGYTFTGGLMTGTATATDNVTCTVPPATVTPSVSAPIFSTKEKPTVFSEEVKN